MINREITRTILETTETTADTQSLEGSALAFVFLASQKFYVGFPGPFAARYFKMGTVNSNSTTITVKFWDGTAYTDVDDLVDETNGFTKDGYVHWQNVDGWEKNAQTPVSDKELFWTEWTVSNDLSVGTTLESVLNLFSTDSDLQVYYPELVSDARWLPDGQTDLLPQHKGAKDWVVQRLISRRVIILESQIIDINKVAIPAVHAAAGLIYSGSGGGEEIQALADTAFEKALDWLADTNFNADENEDGQVSDQEKADISSDTGLFRR